MPVLVWDNVGDRVYESGLDKGVLYLPDGSAVPWNGLTSIIEKFDKELTPVYYDGMKISDLVVLGDFSATMKAVTYPDEFLEVEGIAPMRSGLFVGDQPPQVFGLCYRTHIGNDLVGDTLGYKIHILYNVTAIPNDKTYATMSSDPSLVEFEWNIVAVPEEVPGFRPTSHITINSTDLDPWLLEEIEELLYGSNISIASLIPMAELTSLILNWFRVKITDNGDGTWTATSHRDGFISFLDSEDTLFQIVEVNAIYLNDTTYEVSDTIDVADVPQIQIVDRLDGTWYASTEHENLIVSTGPGEVEIRNANVVYTGIDIYQISDTSETD